MATRSNSSRERILSTAEALILQRGFAGTTIDEIADRFSSTVEGGIVLARVYGDNNALVAQIQAYRNHLRMLFGEI